MDFGIAIRVVSPGNPYGQKLITLKSPFIPCRLKFLFVAFFWVHKNNDAVAGNGVSSPLKLLVFSIWDERCFFLMSVLGVLCNHFFWDNLWTIIVFRVFFFGLPPPKPANFFLHLCSLSPLCGRFRQVPYITQKKKNILTFFIFIFYEGSTIIIKKNFFFHFFFNPVAHRVHIYHQES